MKKEKQVRTYQRRTKTGKLVTVRAHTASYEAAERAKEMAAKKGAGNELEEKMKKKKAPKELELPFEEEEKKVAEEVKEHEKPTKSTKKDASAKKTTKEKSAAPAKKTTKEKSVTSKPKSDTSESPAVTGGAFKAWYHFNDWDSPRRSWPKEVRETDAALKKKMGKKAYDKFCEDVDNGYSSRGHVNMFKKVYPEQYSKEVGARKLVGTARAQRTLAGMLGAEGASKKFDKVVKDNNKILKESKSKATTSKKVSSRSSLSDRAMQDLIKKGYSQKVLGKMKDEGYNFHSQKWSNKNEKTPFDIAYKMYGGKSKSVPSKSMTSKATKGEVLGEFSTKEAIGAAKKLLKSYKGDYDFVKKYYYRSPTMTNLKNSMPKKIRSLERAIKKLESGKSADEELRKFSPFLSRKDFTDKENYSSVFTKDNKAFIKAQYSKAYAKQKKRHAFPIED